MKQEIKRKWVEALRSGKYNQNEECALLVFSIIKIENNSFYDPLPVEVGEKIINMNDGINGERKHNFKQIARYIEKNL